MQRAPKESATGRIQAKVLGRVRRKGGRCAKGRVIVDVDGEGADRSTVVGEETRRG